MSDAGDAHAPGHEVGSLADEAAKLFGALAGWARDQAGDASEGLSDLAAHAAASAHDLNEHLATGSTECTVCPICRTVHAVRHLSPEVRTHLTAAAASLAQAVAAVMASPVPRAEDQGGVEHIDLADDWPEDE
ncbi:hypothetical protein [Nocardioides sp.]|uniref:hypothetical protein n=1 Tax=Nocardioides sp. TaxID=35761 RepID=UPI0035AE6AFE